MNKTNGGDGGDGLKHSESSKKKISSSLKGKMIGAKNPSYGKASWNSGLTKETNDKLAEISRKISSTKKGTNTGVNNQFFGKTHSDETKQIISNSWTQERKFATAISQSKNKKQFLLKVTKDGIVDYMFFSGFCKKYNLNPENIRSAYNKCKKNGIAKTKGWILELTHLVSDDMQDNEIALYSHIIKENY